MILQDSHLPITYRFVVQNLNGFRSLGLDRLDPGVNQMESLLPSMDNNFTIVNVRVEDSLGCSMLACKPRNNYSCPKIALKPVAANQSGSLIQVKYIQFFIFIGYFGVFGQILFVFNFIERRVDFEAFQAR